VLRTPHSKKTKVLQNENENSGYEIEKDEMGKECEILEKNGNVRIQDFGGEF
jgi:hypothetical protein